MNPTEKKPAVSMSDQGSDNADSDAKPADQVKVNWSYWARMPGWRMKEASALLLAIEPPCEGFEDERDFPLEYHKLLRMLMRAHHMEIIESPIRPQEFLEWAKSNDWKIPPPLEEAISRQRRKLRNWRRLAIKRRERIIELESELAQRDAKIEPKALKTLLAMILGMAERKYRYDSPEGRSAVTNIESDLVESNTPVTGQTIRNWLEKAKGTFRG
jgi:Ser/Thr protein kinase RdoA (MazF antagonist)